MSSKINIFWFRRDLRLEDNAGLYHSLKSGQPVLPVFIFDKNILDDLEDKADRRVTFIHQALNKIQLQLAQLGTSLVVIHDTPSNAFRQLTERYPIHIVFTNHDYEPYARKRDEQIKDLLEERGVNFLTFKDHVIFEKNEVLKENSSPYNVFTPYSRKWKEKFNDFYLRAYPTRKYYSHFYLQNPSTIPSLNDIGFQEAKGFFPEPIIPAKLIKDYARERDFPAKDGTTHLGVHLRFGTMSIRKLAAFSQMTNETFLNELIWREFFQMILWHYPQVVAASFKPQYEQIRWRNNETEFQRWCDGKTGYPIVDAGMRELNATGFMHNRIRMITASFLTKLLLIDWRWGEAYFAEKLLDYELASNNGNWQWAAGCGCDAAPYFRIFNPHAQTEKFDPDNEYIGKWVTEWNSSNYPEPVVEYKPARQRALKVYGQAVNERKIIS